jgi:hypothetical protein
MKPEELRKEALAWAEFLYDEYMLNKQKKLHLSKSGKKIKKAKTGGRKSEGSK